MSGMRNQPKIIIRKLIINWDLLGNIFKYFLIKVIRKYFKMLH